MTADFERLRDLTQETLAGEALFARDGDSAANAQNKAYEYVSRFNIDRPALLAMVLTMDLSILTSINNDYGFGHLFAYGVGARSRG